MMKWLWKFSNEDHMLWQEVIKAKYGMEDKWMTEMVSTPYKYTVWRAIRNPCSAISENQGRSGRWCKDILLGGQVK